MAFRSPPQRLGQIFAHSETFVEVESLTDLKDECPRSKSKARGGLLDCCGGGRFNYYYCHCHH